MTNRKIVINETAHEKRVALVEDGNITELFIERRGGNDRTGNIYKGRVQRVLPGMQAAFVDIGLKQAAFLYVNDVLKDNILELEEFFGNNDNYNGIEYNLGQTDSNEIVENSKRDINIEDLISEGQELLVQVAKTPIGTKGARITTHISLPGRFLVLMPSSNHIGVSRRIEDETERQRLKEIIEQIRNDDLGYIVRTASEGIAPEKISQEMTFLKNLWQTIKNRYFSAATPALVHQELNVCLKAVRDLLIHDAEKVIIDSEKGFNSILEFLDTFMPSLKGAVELYEGSEPIFDAFNLEGDISRALKKKVWLKSGGYIVIEQTEALVAIDVNTGRYVGKHNLEETILKTNLEAVKEIAYQVRLRDIGGIIIIDFIDMEKKSNQDKIFNALNEAFSKDRSKTHILPMSEMGLVQMTRKRIRQPLNRQLCEPCFYCDGEGFLLSKKSVCYNIFREIVSNMRDMLGSQLTIKVNPMLADYLHKEETDLIDSLEQMVGKQIQIYPDDKFHLEQFDIFETYR